MNKIILQLILIFLAVVLQINPSLSPSYNPNLIFAVAFALLLAGFPKEAGLWMIGGGLLLDLFTPGRYGALTISFAIPYLTAYFLVTRFFQELSIILFIFLVWTACLVQVSLLLLLAKVWDGPEVFFTTLVTTVISLGMFLVLTAFRSQKEAKLGG